MKRNLTNGFPPFIFCNEDKPARCQLIHQQAGKELIRGTVGSFQEKTKTLNVFCIIASTILYSIPNHHTGCPRKKCVSAVYVCTTPGCPKSPLTKVNLSVKNKGFLAGHRLKIKDNCLSSPADESKTKHFYVFLSTAPTGVLTVENF